MTGRDPADRYVLLDLLNATAKSVGWKPFSADTQAGRITVTYTAESGEASLDDSSVFIPPDESRLPE